MEEVLLTCLCVALVTLVFLRDAVVALLAEAVVRLLYLGSPLAEALELPLIALDGLEYP